MSILWHLEDIILFSILDECRKQVLLNEENFIHLISPEKYKIWIKQAIPWATGYILSSFGPCSFCIHLNFKHVTSGTGPKAIITTGILQGQKASWSYLRSCLKNKNVRNTLDYTSRLDRLPTMCKDQFPNMIKTKKSCHQFKIFCTNHNRSRLHPWHNKQLMYYYR